MFVGLRITVVNKCFSAIRVNFFTLYVTDRIRVRSESIQKEAQHIARSLTPPAGEDAGGFPA
jgi:hypothetical protein